MVRIFIALVVAILGLSCSRRHSDPEAAGRAEHSMAELDKYIAKKEHYVALREELIARFKDKARASGNPVERFNAYTNLYEEYQSYIYDSAFVYAGKMLDEAFRLDDKEKTIIAKKNIAFCYLSSGLFREASEMMATIDITGTTPETKVAYYSLMGRLYGDMADYGSGVSFSAEYTQRGIQYYDSVIVYSPVASPEMWSNVGFKRMRQGNFPAAIDAFQTLLNSQPSIDDHKYAIATSCMGFMYWQTGDPEQAIYYLSQAAIGDIRSATKEGVALMNLASILYERGKVAQANRYIRIAMDDAGFYNARQRMVQISAVLPIVEKERADAVMRQRNNLIVFGAFVSLLCVIVFTATSIILKQMKQLRKARRTIQLQNKNLKLANAKLIESNEIKDEYIAQSLYVKSEYIERLENIYRMINRKLMARQYDDIHSYIKESDLKKERENMYSSFDQTFLKLFPGFIEEYNELFRPEDSVVPDSSRRLTPELRIFALIRLGIGETERIARFLDYSVNTINTYKTKVKNKSVVPNEQFEHKIMEIKSIRLTPR